ncbi:MAG: hypothetical protein ACJ73D_11800, partial [Pyrinomonadaceae bacterium]
GDGGTRETESDDKLRLMHETWKDKAGRRRETHAIRYEGNTVTEEVWSFSRPEKSPYPTYFVYVPKTGALQKNFVLVAHPTKTEFEAWIVTIEKEFVADGTIAEPWVQKEKEVETKVVPPVLTKERFGPTKIDPCLVGTWKSEAGDYKVLEMYSSGGLVFKVAKNGDAMFDYDGLKEAVRKFRYGGDISDTVETTKATGKATGVITTSDNKSIEVESGPVMNVTVKVTFAENKSEPREFKLNDFLPSTSEVGTYTCNGNILTLGTIKFKKVE